MNEMNELQKSIIDALKLLIQRDCDLIETQPKEECINHKLAQYLECTLIEKNLLPNHHNVDMEYDKYKAGKKKSSDGRNIRPDIIVHRRRSGNEDNLIVIEAKKSYGSEDDRSKVKDLVDSKKFSYSLGAVISYLPQKEYVKIKFYERDKGWKEYLLNKGDFTIRETNR